MNIFKKYRWLIIIVVVITISGAGIFTILKPVYFNTSISFSINRLNHQTTGDYQYDGYYAIQASDLFSQTVMSWMLTPSVLLEIYDQAGIDPQITSLEEISSRFKVKKYSPQNIVITYKERDYQTAEKISTAVISIIEEKAKNSNTTIDHEALFEVKGATPVIVESTSILWLNILIALISGLVIGSLAAYIIEYLKKDNINQGNE